MKICLSGGTLIDGTGAEPKPHTTIVIEGSKIDEVSSETGLKRDGQVFDVSGKTVMPGIIDTHVHYMPWTQWMINKQNHTISYHIARGIAGMQGLLERGVTTARDMGGLEIGICDAQEQGLIVGPRTRTVCVIIQSTSSLNIPGVGAAISPQGLITTLPGLPVPFCDGPYECRAKVREALRAGAHFIKMANTSTQWTERYLRTDRPHFTVEEITAIVDEAHRAGTEVCCHVCNYKSSQAVLEALEGGVDLIDHGTYLDDECIDIMARNNTWYSPMFSVMNWHRNKNPDPYARKTAGECYEISLKSVQKAVEAGVRICMGTDHAYEIGWHGDEIKLMVDAGMTPMQAIVSSTGLAAEALKMQDLVGTVEVGKEADLLVVDGDPLVNPEIVADPKHLDLVMQAGKPVAGPMKNEFTYPIPDRIMNQFY
jgi:imidazolonepropionase-like amidohydrolase